ncbi:polysaccharide deacetylase [Halosimplex carlsbadense 2-9-1]|uniref:Polysaccharide deacetylase n=1 Tax=Halosimplex carlsbadense 2-9-1 TaxID=797114 RepID=M0CW43_9EURY|nr:polysaccharide deacetylase family protein [Halosimplex carlsbadense]ELZ27451.1 polysaccharide deacetylase [Halosimplex carlsbadense 2-9-1]
MVDSEGDRSCRTVCRRGFVGLLGSVGLSALAGCGSGGSDGTATPAGAGDGETTETGGSTTATQRPATESAEPATDSSTAGPDPTSRPGDALAGSLPTPDTAAVARPDGEAGGLEVLDWAGFSGAVSYTFDDGQPSHAEHYDALQSTGANMTFYLSEQVDFEGADATWKRAAADGHEIGNHTTSHPYADLSGSSFGDPLDSPAAEIERCSTYITEATAQPDVWTMAAPFGDDGWADHAESGDLFLNRGVGGGAVAPGDGADPYDLPCYMAREGDTAETFTELIDGARSAGEWQILLFHSILPTDQQWYAPVDIDAITDSVDHATGLGDVWVDTVANIGAYWRGGQILSEAERTESGGETTWNWSLPDAFPADQHVRVTVDGGTLLQNGGELSWDPHGYYEVSLDAGSLTLAP